jgi:hypothetical protein
MHENPTQFNNRSGICLMRGEVTRELNIGQKCANWKMITADGNVFALAKVAESLHVNVHGMVIPVPIF